MRSRSEKVKLIPTGEVKCLWMTAEQIVFKLCENDYKCEYCQFNSAFFSKNELPTLGKVIPEMEEEQEVVLLDLFQEKISGDIESGSGPDKQKCPSSQTSDWSLPLQIKLKKTLYYHPGHTWIDILNNEELKLGIDAFLMQFISRVKHLILPDTGSLIVEGQLFIWIGTEFGSFPILTPVSGLIKEVNPQVLETPELCLMDPYDRGWLVKVKVADALKSMENCFYGTTVIPLFIEHGQILKNRLFELEKRDLSLKDLMESHKESQDREISALKKLINSKSFYDIFSCFLTSEFMKKSYF